jgi:hypothetical protein
MGPGDVSSSTSVVTVVTKRTAVVVAAVVVVVVMVVGSCVVGEGDGGAAAVVAAAVGITSGMQSPASSQLTSSPSPCTHQWKSLSRSSRLEIYFKKYKRIVLTRFRKWSYLGTVLHTVTPLVITNSDGSERSKVN